jgi:hypothetical protein
LHTRCGKQTAKSFFSLVELGRLVGAERIHDGPSITAGEMLPRDRVNTCL